MHTIRESRISISRRDASSRSRILLSSYIRANSQLYFLIHVLDRKRENERPRIRYPRIPREIYSYHERRTASRGQSARRRWLKESWHVRRRTGHTGCWFSPVRANRRSPDYSPSRKDDCEIYSRGIPRASVLFENARLSRTRPRRDATDRERRVSLSLSLSLALLHIARRDDRRAKAFSITFPYAVTRAPVIPMTTRRREQHTHTHPGGLIYVERTLRTRRFIPGLRVFVSRGRLERSVPLDRAVFH